MMLVYEQFDNKLSRDNSGLWVWCKMEQRRDIGCHFLFDLLPLGSLPDLFTRAYLKWPLTCLFIVTLGLPFLTLDCKV